MHPAGLDPVIEQFRDDPAVIGYYITDEPNAHAFPNLATVVSYIRARDPRRFTYINLFPTYASSDQLGSDSYRDHVRDFTGIVQPNILSYDHYCFLNDTTIPSYFDNLEIVSEQARRASVPFCNIIQAINSQAGPWRRLSAGEYRYQVYSSLAYGARGIMYFNWNNGLYGILHAPADERAEGYAAIQALNTEINALEPVYLYWGTTDGTDTGWQHVTFVGRPGAGPLTVTLTGLAPGTTYFCRFFTSNGETGDWSESVMTFNTPCNLPFRETFEARTEGDIDGQNGWWTSAPDAALVQASVTHANSDRACSVSDTTLGHAFTADDVNVVWTEMHVQPVFGDWTIPTATTHADHIWVNHDGHVVANDGISDVTLSDKPAVTSNSWTRFVVRLVQCAGMCQWYVVRGRCGLFPCHAHRRRG